MEGNTKIYNIYYNQELDAVIMEWHGYATSAQFREGTELMLDILNENNTYKVLGDIKEMVLIGMEDQHWLDFNFLPRAINAGFKVLALVKPDNYFNKVAIESISYKVDQEKLKIIFFDNLEDAKKWIASN